jgi:cytochrome c1
LGADEAYATFEPGGPGLTVPQATAFAKDFKVKDGPNDQGEMFERDARPADRFAGLDWSTEARPVTPSASSMSAPCGAGGTAGRGPGDTGRPTKGRLKNLPRQTTMRAQAAWPVQASGPRNEDVRSLAYPAASMSRASS